MRLKEQVVSFELSKKLKELGVSQGSLFRWVDITKEQQWGIVEIDYSPRLIFDGSDQWVAAFTVSELAEFLPIDVYSFRKNSRWVCSGNIISSESNTEADARAKMLIYLIEKGEIDVRKTKPMDQEEN